MDSPNHAKRSRAGEGVGHRPTHRDKDNRTAQYLQLRFIWPCPLNGVRANFGLADTCVQNVSERRGIDGPPADDCDVISGVRNGSHATVEVSR